MGLLTGSPGLTSKSWGSSRLRSPLYFTVVLNLDCSLVFSSSRSIITFSSREKVTKKRPAHGKNSLTLVDNTAFSHSVRCKLRLHYVRLTAGGIIDLQANSGVASNIIQSKRVLKAHSFGELKLPSSQTLLPRNGAT